MSGDQSEQNLETRRCYPNSSRSPKFSSGSELAALAFTPSSKLEGSPPFVSESGEEPFACCLKTLRPSSLPVVAHGRRLPSQLDKVRPLCTSMAKGSKTPGAPRRNPRADRKVAKTPSSLVPGWEFLCARVRRIDRHEQRAEPSNQRRTSCRS